MMSISHALLLMSLPVQLIHLMADGWQSMLKCLEEAEKTGIALYRRDH
jgi:hypothetical protein